ncbi:hypothetical protein J2R95_003137 [Bradyrhizobium japonicum]|uniref:hypothetical protein n=1 Tax=Bradyrhizobium japonicum TaxID=375 RepID=UPI00209F793E|nr:hypothetical protein [Bradyrhizobium japonicum]MCP1937342.1 hypothetical protein [Bradyrhizobium japonicum]
MRGLAYNCAEIIRIDNELRELVKAPVVRITSDLRGSLSRLKEERSGHVRVIQNYKP